MRRRSARLRRLWPVSRRDAETCSPSSRRPRPRGASVVPLIVIVSLGLSLAMAGAWLVQRSSRNAGWVDVAWTCSLGLGGLAYATVPLEAPWTVRQWLVGALIALWSLRLGTHLVARTRHGPEDSRYAQFRREWGTDYERRMFGFLQIQAAAGMVLALTILVAARNPQPLGFADLAGVAVALIAFGGEAIADRQLRRFRERAANHGGICNQGLWRWSRHPNYFFEWLGWLAYPLFAIRPETYPWGWLSLSAPVLMYFLLIYVSGIPLLEQQMLRSRGDAFRAYQASTHAFFPLPPARS